MGTPEISNAVIQGGALVIVAWVIWQVFSKIIPEQNKAKAEEAKQFVVALSDQRKDFVSAIDKQGKEFTTSIADVREEVRGDLKGLTRKVDGQTELLIRHDATVRGVNPETMGLSLEEIRGD